VLALENMVQWFFFGEMCGSSNGFMKTKRPASQEKGPTHWVKR